MRPRRHLQKSARQSLALQFEGVPEHLLERETPSSICGRGVLQEPLRPDPPPRAQAGRFRGLPLPYLSANLASLRGWPGFFAWFGLGLGLLAQEQQAEAPTPTPPPPAAAVAPAPPPAAAAMASPRHCLVIGRDFELRANETADQVVVICGAAKIDGRINGDLISILGHVQLGSSAQLERSLIAVGGQVDIAPEATVRDDLFVVGGELKKALGFSPGRRQQLIGLPGFRGLSWLTDWVRHGLLRGLLLPLREAWLWTAALILFAFNLLLCLLFPRPLQVCTDAVCQRPVSALTLGLLAVLLLGPVGLLLVLSCIGVVAFPFLFCALFLALAFGLIAVYRAVGHTLGRWLRLGILDQPIPALCLGTAVFYAGYCVPVLGFAIGGLGLLLGFGGALWALSGAVQREDSPRLVGVTPPPLASDTLSGAPLDLASLPRAGFGARLAALLIDLVILLILVCIPSPLAAAPVFSWLVYCAAFWAWRGATVGGMILGLRGVRPDGQPLGLGIAIVRALASLLSLVVLGLGFLWAAWDREGQTWHDKIAGTIVVRLPRPVPRPAAPPTAGVGMPPVSPVPPPAVPPVVPPPAAGSEG